MFRKTKSETPAAPSSETDLREGGKGRPTPSRKEAQAAARERARAGRDKRAAAQMKRQRRAEDSQRIREGMKTGDERYLMPRDKGPVRRFVRDWVDSRITFLELMLPALVIVMGLQLAGELTISNAIWSVMWILVLVDITWMFLRLGGEIRRRFPDEETKGWRFYAIMRALQIRPLRIPKSQVKLYQPLPERYR